MAEERNVIGLDNPIFAGRLRGYGNNEEGSQPMIAAQKSAQPTPEKKVSKTETEKPKKIEPIKFYFDDIEKSKSREYKHKFRFSRRYNLVSNSLVFLAILLLSFGAYVAVSGLRINKSIQGAKVSAQANNEEKPDETPPKPEDLNNYNVAPDMPRFIYLDKFNDKSRVRHLGVNQKGAMQAPNNVHDSGWYNQSAKPGSIGGASVIAGHVSGLSTPGVFHNLKNLNQSDTITVERGDGLLLKYKVIAKEVYDADKVDMNKVMISHNRSKHGLNLITCTGQYQGMTYTQRLVVYTELVQ